MNTILSIKQRYDLLFPDEVITPQVVTKIEQQLQLQLPDDFKEIALFFNGGLVGGISIFSYANHHPNLIEETLRLRKDIQFPHSLVFLAEPAGSMIVLDTATTPSVIWCDSIDVYQLHDRSFQVAPDTWDTFSDFFAYLLTQEEQEA